MLDGGEKNYDDEWFKTIVFAFKQAQKESENYSQQSRSKSRSSSCFKRSSRTTKS